MQVRVISRPDGEAPEWVRNAWIGLSLPLVVDRQRTWRGLGVLTGPTNILLQRWALMRGRGVALTGYLVNAKVAVDLLETSSPQAAAWWRANTPKLLDKGRCFVFQATACELEQLAEPAALEASNQVEM
jgi:hypothetical protein